MTESRSNNAGFFSMIDRLTIYMIYEATYIEKQNNEDFREDRCGYVSAGFVLRMFHSCFMNNCVCNIYAYCHNLSGRFQPTLKIAP